MKRTFDNFERYLYLYSQQSRVLQLKNGKQDLPGAQPTSTCNIWGEKGIRDLLYELSTKDRDQKGFLGTLSLAEDELRAVWNHWNHLNSTEAFPKSIPDKGFQEKIDKASANVEVLKQEIAVLKAIVAEFDAKHEAEKAAIIRRRVGQCVMQRNSEGKNIMDGRLIENGLFADTGESVEEYRNYHMALKRKRRQQIAS